MAYTLTATTKAVMSPSYVVTRDAGSFTYAPNYTKSYSYANGAGLNAVNKGFDDDRSLADGASESLDLAGGLTDLEGALITFTAVKSLLIVNTGATVLTVGNAAANAWVGPFGAATHTLAIPPGGSIHFENPTAAGWVVTAGTADLLKVANAAGAAGSYRIFILGI